MHFEKKDIEEYLQGVWNAIDNGKYQIASRPKNKDFFEASGMIVGTHAA